MSVLLSLLKLCALGHHSWLGSNIFISESTGGSGLGFIRKAGSNIAAAKVIPKQTNYLKSFQNMHKSSSLCLEKGKENNDDKMIKTSISVGNKIEKGMKSCLWWMFWISSKGSLCWEILGKKPLVTINSTT